MNLDRAIALASQAHFGQVDKAGAPYILHPLRVMMAMGDDDSRVVAILHDVVEDSDITLDDLRAEGFPALVVDAIDALTRRQGEAYEAFILRVGQNSIARSVKIADLHDNLDVSRFSGAELDARLLERLKRYLSALQVLQGKF
jgi:(p)ppGpp synthase/HD superfamily hydrolase